MWSMPGAKDSTKQVFLKDIDAAASRVLGEKMCFNCQTYKKLDQGSQIKKGNKVQWKCFMCQKRQRF